jgi:hypothetical protein
VNRADDLGTNGRTAREEPLVAAACRRDPGGLAAVRRGSTAASAGRPDGTACQRPVRGFIAWWIPAGVLGRRPGTFPRAASPPVSRVPGQQGASGERLPAGGGSTGFAVRRALRLAVNGPVMSLGGFSGGDAAITLDRCKARRAAGVALTGVGRSVWGDRYGAIGMGRSVWGDREEPPNHGGSGAPPSGGIVPRRPGKVAA